MSENLGRKPVEGNEKVFWENLDGWQVWFGLRGNVAPFAIISVDEGLECSFIWDQRILYHFFQNEQRSPLNPCLGLFIKTQRTQCQSPVVTPLLCLLKTMVVKKVLMISCYVLMLSQT